MKIVVIGHGMVGHCFLQALAEPGLSGAQVTVLCEEPRAAYDRVHLSEYFSGRDAESLAMCDADYYASHGVQLHLGEAVLEIDARRIASSFDWSL